MSHRMSQRMPASHARDQTHAHATVVQPIHWRPAARSIQLSSSKLVPLQRWHRGRMRCSTAAARSECGADGVKKLIDL